MHFRKYRNLPENKNEVGDTKLLVFDILFYIPLYESMWLVDRSYHQLIHFDMMVGDGRVIQYIWSSDQ